MTTLLMLFIFVPILSVILLALNLLLAPSRPDESKVSAFESGIYPIKGQTRSSFHINFYQVALLFLVFDLELILLTPLGVSLSEVHAYGFAIALIFFIVLTIGFILEIGTRSSKIETVTSLKPHNNIIFNIPFQRFLS